MANPPVKSLYLVNVPVSREVTHNRSIVRNILVAGLDDHPFPRDCAAKACGVSRSGSFGRLAITSWCHTLEGRRNAANDRWRLFPIEQVAKSSGDTCEGIEPADDPG
jgi:hypothetical protein